MAGHSEIRKAQAYGGGCHLFGGTLSVTQSTVVVECGKNFHYKNTSRFLKQRFPYGSDGPQASTYKIVIKNYFYIIITRKKRKYYPAVLIMIEYYNIIIWPLQFLSENGRICVVK